MGAANTASEFAHRHEQAEQSAQSFQNEPPAQPACHITGLNRKV
jgi:hypothetical protein